MTLCTIPLPAVALLALLAPACAVDRSALGQYSAEGLPAAAPLATGRAAEGDAPETAETTIGGGLMSDYRYRGLSLSRHGPSAYSTIEVDHHGFYLGGIADTVRLPGDPAIELTATSGFRHDLGGISFDLGVEGYYYPGETLAPGSGASTYWQSNLSASRRILDAFDVKGLFAYSPSVWNSGAWGAYGSGELKFDLPKLRLGKRDVTWQLVGELGYQGFGTTSLGSQLPDYAHWRLGLVFGHGDFSFEVNYQDTNLSKESCFVLTGDGSVVGDGRTRFAENDLGLQSNLCGRTVVGTLSFEFKPPRR